MAYVRPSSLGDFAARVSRCEPRARQLLADDLLAVLRAQPTAAQALSPPDRQALLEGITAWLDAGNFKVAQSGLEAITALTTQLGPDFSPMVSTVLPHIIDRLADTKDSVRAAARTALVALASTGAAQPRLLLTRLACPPAAPSQPPPAIAHKSAMARESAIQCCAELLNAHGAGALALRGVLKDFAAMLGDPSEAVRNAAFSLMVDMYMHVGDKLRNDLHKKDLIPANRMAALEAKFQQVKQAGLLLPTAVQTSTFDEMDNASLGSATPLGAPPVPPSSSRPIKRALSAPRSYNHIDTPSEANRRMNTAYNGGARRLPNIPSQTPRHPNCDSGGGAGSVTMETFEAAFLACPPAALYGARDLEDAARHSAMIIGDKSADWEKRVEALKKVRSLLVANAHGQYPVEFAAQLKDLPQPFLTVIRELRSQVVREACITIAFMAKMLKNKLDQFTTYIIQDLINLVPNSAKVISSASNVCIRYIVKYVNCHRIIPIIATSIEQSKAKEIRSALSELICLLLEAWPVSMVERQMESLKNILIRGVADADPTARQHSRRAFGMFRRMFPAEGETLFWKFDAAVQRALERENKNTPSTAATSTESLHRVHMLDRRTPSSPRSPSTSVSAASPNARSISAVDATAAQRARARAMYSQMSRAKLSSGTASLPRVKKSPGTPMSGSGVPPSPERTARTSRARQGVSQSQPSSRSSSPSSRLNSSVLGGPLSLSSTRPRLPSGIPRSLAGSRETSPTRLSRGAGERRGTTPQRAPTAALRMLQQSRDAERDTSLGPHNTALSPDDSLGLENLRLRDDDSEASSVCSERSVDSYRRHDSFSWTGSQGRLGGISGMSEIMSPPPPPAEIIALCASTHWTERKDGLIHLTNYLNSGHLLPPSDLRSLTDLLGRMFVDAHTKVFSLFLDAVAELIVAHSQQLQDWLYLLLTRLLMKLGSDLLGSIQAKVYKMLVIVHEYFPPLLQLQCIFRFLADGAHAPSSKTRAAALDFLAQLAGEYCQPISLSTFVAQGTNLPNRALNRVCTAATDPRPSDTRQNARRALAALYDCNAPVMTQLLGEMSPETQAAVANIVQTHVKRTSSCGDNSPPPAVNLNAAVSGGTEDVYRSLRRTTAEIRNYTAAAGKYGETTLTSASRDSGISQLSEQNGFLQNGHCGGDFTITTSNNTPQQVNSPRAASADSSEEGGANTKDSSPTVVDGGQMVHRANSDDRDSGGRGDRNRQYEKDDDGYLILKDGKREAEIVEKFVALKTASDSPVIWERYLNAIIEVIRHGDCRTAEQHFTGIVRICLIALSGEIGSNVSSPGSSGPDLLSSPMHRNSEDPDNSQERRDPVVERCAALSVKVFILLCRRTETRPLWLKFFDLILVKLMEKYGGPNKELTRAVDSGISAIARAVPAAQTIALAGPVLKTRDAPHSVCAMKLIADVARERPNEITDEHLDKIMLAVATHADHPSSPVRKAAVFCIVALTLAVGEERMEPFIRNLSPSKIRLLQVYLRKTRGEQQQDSFPKT